MKNRVSWCLAVVGLACVSLVAGCDELEGGGGGIGNGGGLANFNQGYVFIRADNRNVYIADRADYSAVASLTSGGNHKHPSLSRNGRQVAFVRQVGAESSIQVVAVSGGTPSTVLASDAQKGAFSHPVFSPDGLRLAFSFIRGGASYVGVVNTDGSGFEELGGGSPAMSSPSFYPDGLSVLVAAGSGTGMTSLKRVVLANRAVQDVLLSLGPDALSVQNRVVLSPAGTHAVFDGRTGSGVARIFAANLGTLAVTQLTDYPGEANANDSFPGWSGSSQVTFTSDSGGNDNVYAISVNAVKQSGSLQLPSAVEAWFGP
jgi:TolB protein